MLGRMGVKLIVGPPNSGRTGKMLAAFKSAASRDPVLVVPTVDDVERFEEELTRDDQVVIGATVGTFDQLFGLVARATDAPAGPAVSRTQRLRLTREATARAELRILAASSRRPGFPAALDELVSELQAALVDPVSLRERAAEAGTYEFEIATLYESYLTLRDELALHDDHSLAAAATAALRRRPEVWGRRPVFLYGFDDLTIEQLELVRELSVSTDVTVALPWEDRESLTEARGALFAELRDFDGVTIERLASEPRFTQSSTLFQVERRFGQYEGGEPGRERRRGRAARLGGRTRGGRGRGRRGRAAPRRRAPRRRDRDRASRPALGRAALPSRADALRHSRRSAGRPGGHADHHRRGPDRVAPGSGRRRRRLGPARLPAHTRRRLAVEDRLVRAEAAARPAADDGRGARGMAARGRRTATRGCARSRSSARRVREPRSCARPASRLAGSPSRPCAIRVP